MVARSLVLLLVTAVSALLARRLVVTTPTSTDQCCGRLLRRPRTGLGGVPGRRRCLAHAQPTVSGPNTTFRAQLSPDRGAIAMVSRSGAFSLVSVFYGTPRSSRRQATRIHVTAFQRSPKTLLGTAIGIETGEVAFVGASFGSRVRVGVDSTFELKALPSGPRDLLATRLAPRQRHRPHYAHDPAARHRRAGRHVASRVRLCVDRGVSRPRLRCDARWARCGERGVRHTVAGEHDEISVTLATNLTARCHAPLLRAAGDASSGRAICRLSRRIRMPRPPAVRARRRSIPRA